MASSKRRACCVREKRKRKGKERVFYFGFSRQKVYMCVPWLICNKNLFSPTPPIHLSHYKDSQWTSCLCIPILFVLVVKWWSLTSITRYTLHLVLFTFTTKTLSYNIHNGTQSVTSFYNNTVMIRSLTGQSRDRRDEKPIRIQNVRARALAIGRISQLSQTATGSTKRKGCM